MTRKPTAVEMSNLSALLADNGTSDSACLKDSFKSLADADKVKVIRKSNQLSVTILNLEPNYETPVHHHDSLETLFVLRGKADVLFEDHTVKLEENALVIIEAGTRYQIRVREDERLVVLRHYAGINTKALDAERDWNEKTEAL